jgi:hypothetical protein
MIAPETLQAIASFAASLASLNEETLASIKGQWPELRFTLCDDDDMPARLPPIVRRDTFNLYLVSGSEHCLSLTDDPLHAIGVVLAVVDER